MTPSAPAATTPPVQLGAMTSPEVVRAGGIAGPEGMAVRPLVLVPMGSTEQHGPHLPLETDSLIASAVALAVAERMVNGWVAVQPQVVVAPTVAFGASGEHQSFAGTVSIGTEALRVVLVELVRSLSTWAARVVFVNGHGGNLSALVDATDRLRQEGHDVAWVPCAGEPSDEDRMRAARPSDLHAGHTETSLLLHLAPHLVRLERAEPGDTRPLQQTFALMSAGGVAAVSPNGVLGDPTTATATDGAALFAAIVASVVRRIADNRPDQRGYLP